MTARHGRDERGSAGIEAPIAITSLLLVGFFIIAALRIVGSGGDVDAAARAAARAAAAAYSPTAAQAAAEQVATGALAERGIACRDLTVAVTGPLTPGSVVRVDVTCAVGLDDVTPVGLGRTRLVHGNGVEYVDAVRGGTP